MHDMSTAGLNPPDLGAIVITGAAGGMGRPSAVRFAASGRRLILCDLREAPLQSLAEELRATGAGVDILAGDIAAPDFPETVLAKLGDTPLGVLVHTAGLSPTMADGARIIEVNLFATRRLVEALRPRFAAGGSAVLISSCSAYMVPPGMFDAELKAWLDGDNGQSLLSATPTPEAAYPASKKGVIALVAHEAAAFGALGARISSIAPGFIDTSMGRAEMQVSEKMVEMIARTPLARLGSGDEIASVVEFLCSPAASYVSGCDIKVDGGILGRLGL
jgi:NAD(P)-dependent dehydrogenase (short-subunit alcohol dehydrogenase family)